MKVKEESITENDLLQIAQDIIDIAHDLDSNHACVIALSGDLGSGKTTVTQAIARLLKVREQVISPTFVIMKKYKVIDDKFANLIHIDAYRLEASKELFKLGWEELIKDKTNLIIIEWPEKVSECIPKDALRIDMAHESENKRTIKFHA